MPSFDSLVTDKQFRQEIGITGESNMTVRRRDADPPPGWPTLVFQNGRRFRWRSEIERYKAVTAALSKPGTNLPPRPQKAAKADAATEPTAA